jgi:hypothetical protein
MSTAIEKIEQFVNCYDDCEEPKKILTQIHDTAMSSVEADIWTADERSNVLLLYRQLEQLLEAIFELAPFLLQIYRQSK